MAYTKVFAVRQRLDHAVSYAVNPEKTALDRAVDYALDPKKTERWLYGSAVNCQATGTAYEEMTATKKRFGKPDGVLAYHFIQSFAPRETTPEQAHEIGIEFARRCFGDRFECVIGTHLDRNHLHNHVVVNSVSCMDGGKYRSTPASYFYQIRAESDRLCREYGLSVIEPKGKGRHYAEWAAEKAGQPTYRSIVRQDIDAVILKSFTYQSFLDGLRKRGYTVRYDPDRKYTTVQPPGAKRPIRLTEKSLGANYSEEAIKERLARIRDGEAEPKKVRTPQRKRYRYTGNLRTRKWKRLKGFLALYWHYLYLLGKVKRGKTGGAVNRILRPEVLKLERYARQFLYLYRNHITTADGLEERKQAVESEILSLSQQRMPLYGERKHASDEADAAITERIDGLAARLKELRREKKMCAAIEETASNVREKSVTVQDLELQKEAERERGTRKMEREPFQFF